MTPTHADSELSKKGAAVFRTEGSIVALSDASVQQLTAALPQSPQGRVRICAHSSPEDRVHEMIIVLAKGSYIRPHRHHGKSESFHLIEGELDIVIFDVQGVPSEIVRMGPYGNGSGRQFYYRMNAALYHTVIVRTESTVFHETTTGPFVAGDAEFALWAPEVETAEYLRTLPS